MNVFVRAVVAAAVSISALTLAACGSDPVTGPSSPSGGVTDLQIQELRAGTGTEAATGRSLTARYSGWLYDQRQTDNKGAQFDAGTYTFRMGAGDVIRGWDQGFAGMKVGGQRRLTIPPHLGYGAQGSGPIPPNASLVFDVELLDVR